MSWERDSDREENIDSKFLCEGTNEKPAMNNYKDGFEAMRQRALKIIQRYVRIEGEQKDDSEVVNMLNALAGDVMVVMIGRRKEKHD